MANTYPFRVLVWIYALVDLPECKSGLDEVARCRYQHQAENIAKSLVKPPVPAYTYTKVVEVQGHKEEVKAEYYYPDKETFEREKNIPI